MKNIALIVFILGFFALPGLWGVGTFFWYQAHPVAFDRAAWAEAGRYELGSYNRLRMAFGLVQEGRLEHLPRKEVIDLLGQPESHPSLPGSAYWLAPYMLDSWWLHLTYQNGHVKQVEVTSD